LQQAASEKAGGAELPCRRFHVPVFVLYSLSHRGETGHIM